MRQLRVSEAPVRCLAYSPDGAWLATGGDDGQLRLWALPAGEPIDPIDDLGHTGVEALAFHPSGQLLAAGLSQGEVFLLDVASRNIFPRMKTHQGGVRALAWSGDGKTLASSGWDKTVRHWSVTLHEVSVHQAAEVVMGLAFLPGGQALAAVGNAGSVELLQAVPAPRADRAKEKFPLFAVAASPSGGHVATGGAMGEIVLWDIPDLRKAATLVGHDWNVYGLAFAPGGDVLVSGAADGTGRVWDVPARRLVETYRWHSRWVTCVGVSPDGMTAAAGSADGTVVIWDLG